MRGLLAAVIACLIAVKAAVGADISTWAGMVQAECPNRHLDWLCDGCWDDFLAGFEQTLSADTQQRIIEIADYKNRCKDEMAGFSCEMAVHVDALERLELLGDFVSWGCTHYSCDEVSVCRFQQNP